MGAAPAASLKFGSTMQRYVLGNYEVTYDSSVDLLLIYKNNMLDPIDRAKTMAEARNKIEMDQGFDKLKEHPKPLKRR